MKVLRHLLALLAVSVVCPATIIFVNVFVGYVFQPKSAAAFLYFFLDAWAIPGLVISLLVGHRIANRIEQPRKKNHALCSASKLRKSAISLP